MDIFIHISANPQFALAQKHFIRHMALEARFIGYKWCSKNYFHASFQLISFSMSKIAWSDPCLYTAYLLKVN